MSEDKNDERNIYVDNTKEEAVQNENLSFHHSSSSTDELNNSLIDLNLNADSCTEDEPSSAPVEILSEFLSTFMSHDYKSALHYCKLILRYEPDNEIVRDFYPILLEKINSNAVESDDFTDNETSSLSTKSRTSTEYFSSASAGTENTSACSSLSSDDENPSIESSQ